MSELHLIVLWEFARREEQRILDDLHGRLDVIHTEILTWPGDPEACFRRFYGANLADAHGKVRTCGGGAFRLVVVRDNNPRDGLVETSRGVECANLNLFGLKALYREWTGGGHKVHTTNTAAEFARDIYLLTGHAASEWSDGPPPGGMSVLPGQSGWRTLREVFGFLDRLTPYVVLRNAEMLPDAFDHTLHGDIDLLVEDAEATASLLGAKKVFPDPQRVHYELSVGDQPVRFDFRFVGDNYYDARWERRMLDRRVRTNGICLLHPEDAFHALVYHALFHKFEIAPDYVAKAAELARAAGLCWTGYADALHALEDFLARNGYEKTRPTDISVRWNTRLVGWRTLANEMMTLSGMTDVRPACLEAVSAEAPLRTSFFTGFLDGRRCFVKYSPYAADLTAAEWRHPQALAAGTGRRLFERSLFWHMLRSGGAFVITEWIEGETLDALTARRDPLLISRAESIAEDMLAIADALARAKVVHRDIRPTNLFVSADGHLKLIDFQFATSAEKPREAPWIDAHPEILDGLGADYALARGKWNDRFSLRKALAGLPVTPARDRALAALSDGCDVPTLVASCSPRTFRHMRRRHAYLVWKKRLSCLFPRRRKHFRAHHQRELEFLDRVLDYWKVR